MNKRNSMPTLSTSSILVSSKLRRNSMIDTLDTINNKQKPILLTENCNKLSKTNNFKIIKNQFNLFTLKNNKISNFNFKQNQIDAKNCHQFNKIDVLNNEIILIKNNIQSATLNNNTNKIKFKESLNFKINKKKLNLENNKTLNLNNKINDIINNEKTQQYLALENTINLIKNNNSFVNQSSLYNDEIKHIVKPTYSILRSGIIRLTPESMKCKLYCKGAICKYCSVNAWTPEQQAINGLYSSWITENILAMARPTKTTINEYDLIRQFKEKNIFTIINLQCIGEHSFCGPPLVSSGFSYDPEFLMENKIYYYNFAIPDFQPGNIEMIIDIIKVIGFSLKNGKIAIHCHAGLGRTGTLIACYLVWSTNCHAYEAIEFVRHARPKSIQSFKQIEIIVQLERTYRMLSAALPYISIVNSNVNDNCVMPLNYILQNQSRVLPNEEAIKYSHIPKLLFLVCDRLLRLVFEENGVKYIIKNLSQNEFTNLQINYIKSDKTRNIHCCTLGMLWVDWKYAFMQKGREQMKYIINLLKRLFAFPHENDERLKIEFRHQSLIGIETTLYKMDALQLVQLLNACMESIQRPYCDKDTLIKTIKWFATRNKFDTALSSKPLLLLPIINNNIIVDKLKDDSQTINLRKNYLNEMSEIKINQNWHCTILHLLNVLSYLSGENYDILTDLITYWLTGNSYNDVKSAVYCHMRELFVRNVHQQKLQAKEHYCQ